MTEEITYTIYCNDLNTYINTMTMYTKLLQQA